MSGLVCHGTCLRGLPAGQRDSELECNIAEHRDVTVADE